MFKLSCMNFSPSKSASGFVASTLSRFSKSNLREEEKKASLLHKRMRAAFRKTGAYQKSTCADSIHHEILSFHHYMAISPRSRSKIAWIHDCCAPGTEPGASFHFCSRPWQDKLKLQQRQELHILEDTIFFRFWATMIAASFRFWVLNSSAFVFLGRIHPSHSEEQSDSD